MSSAHFWDFTQRRMAVSYRLFGTTYRSLKEGPIDCPETSVGDYHSNPRRAQISFTPRRKPDITQIMNYVTLLCFHAVRWMLP